jgi:hypothetical protein|tara:strand:- start:3311 stop:3511 length:201 start_codon:yes stop_codon:yes gene_type:complete
MKSEIKEPKVSKALVEYLKEVLPQVGYTPDNTLPEIMYDSGKLSVIRFLEDLHERQKNPLKENNAL